MKYIFLMSILIFSTLQSCKVGTSGSWSDENIDPTIKSEIRLVDSQVLKAISSNDPDLLKSNMSKMLLSESGTKLDGILNQVSNIITTDEYSILNQFMVKNSTTNIGNTVMSGISELNDYIIHYQALNVEMFISVLIPKSGNEEFIITNIYGKYSDEWKLNIFQIGQYRIDGQTAPELYTKAEEEFEKGYIVDAANSAFLYSKIVKPGNELWQYQKEKKMEDLQKKIMSSINEQYQFPLILDKIESQPKIVSVYPMVVEEGYFPMIEYITSIDLGDTTNTKRENDSIHKIIGKTFNGIDKDKKYLFYKAYSRMPDGKTQVPTYGFVKELKE